MDTNFKKHIFDNIGRFVKTITLDKKFKHTTEKHASDWLVLYAGHWRRVHYKVGNRGAIIAYVVKVKGTEVEIHWSAR